MRILTVYYSNTSSVHQLAQSIAGHLGQKHEVVVARIIPRVERSYWNWLARSFVPGSSVAIQPVVSDLQQFDRVCLGFPKWTLSCPPVNRYLRLVPSPAGTVFGLFMSFGGFDEDRYLRQMSASVGKKGAVIATLAIKRDLTNHPGCAKCMEAVGRFCEALVRQEEIHLKLDREPGGVISSNL